LQEVANAAYLKGFPFLALLRIAPYCVPGDTRLVSGRATATVWQWGQWHALATFGATIRRYLFVGVAYRCRIGIDKLISLLRVAHGFCVLRPEWCREWCQMASATPYPDGSNRTEGGPCQDDLRPAQGFTPILVYAQVFGVGFHAFMVPYGSILLQHAAVPLPNAR
jgi:hypothetical protein